MAGFISLRYLKCLKNRGRKVPGQGLPAPMVRPDPRPKASVRSAPKAATNESRRAGGSAGCLGASVRGTTRDSFRLLSSMTEFTGPSFSLLGIVSWRRQQLSLRPSHVIMRYNDKSEPFIVSVGSLPACVSRMGLAAKHWSAVRRASRPTPEPYMFSQLSPAFDSQVARFLGFLRTWRANCICWTIRSGSDPEVCRFFTKYECYTAPATSRTITVFWSWKMHGK